MSNGYLVQERSCPRCAIRRTVRVADGSSFCFNCRLQWRTDKLLEDHSGVVLTGSSVALEQFDLTQQARFVIYRAAVRAGFYTDALASSAVRG
jgi:hypothetical protein